MSWRGVVRTAINPMSGLTADVNPVGWTLTVEVWASYAVFCLVVVASQTARRFRLAAYALLFGLARASTFSVEEYGYLQFFVLGMACADTEPGLRAFATRARRAMPRHTAHAIAALVVAGLCAKPPVGLGAIDAIVPPWMNKVVNITLTGGWSAVLAIVVFLVVLVASAPQRLLSTRFPAFLGRISVGLYIVHFPILCTLGSHLLLLLRNDYGLPIGQSKVLAALAAALCSIVVGDLYSRVFDAQAIAVSKAMVRWLEMHGDPDAKPRCEQS
jgi:peptidoglycan/LPS O-acetylase OafA/YrhL